MDNTLHEVKNTFTFIDDILVVTKVTKEEHLEKVEEVTFCLKLEKRNIAQKNTEWLGYKLSAPGREPNEGKVHAITDKLRSKILNDLRHSWEQST